ncbi:hypothetical protein [Phocaeicola plebeius]|jgi:hypothetical protein|uniref:hypothetical protein n=1 Tax=Phocaeicola plebeius TaxID=310297 RepID=UPI00307E0FA4
MATKTEKRIERDFFEFVSNSELAKNISGMVYRKGMRPVGSDKEDIVVKFLSGIDEQIQSGIIVLNIYVPDTTIRSTGAKVEDIKRVEELEELALSFIEENDSTEYELSKDGTPKSLEAEGIEQHFIQVRIKYRRITI